MAVDVIEALQDTPEEYRGDSSFDELWQHGVDSVTLQRGGEGSGRAPERQLDSEETCGGTDK